MKKLYSKRIIVAGLVGIMSVLAVLASIYPIKFLNLELVPTLERAVLDMSIAGGIILGGILLLTLIFGRLYCSTICPYWILQEFAGLIFFIKRKNTRQKNMKFKYLIAGITFGGLFGGSALIIRHIDPYSLFGSAISLGLWGLIFTLGVLALVFFKNRFFCTNICPVGAVLGLVSKMSLNKIHMTDECVSCGLCSKNCQAGCIDYKEKFVDNETCIKCFKCLSVCPKNAIKYGKKETKFDPKKRDFIFATAALGVLATGYAIGLNFAKATAKKIKDVILPAGAQSPNKMANRCLNCNLCINNCPNKILEKANAEFNAVHIDFSKGEGYCEFDCNKCGSICPSGAIKNMSLKEKQHTRIAMAIVDNSKCISCKICEEQCPKHAITIEENKPAQIDGYFCIGCGKCAKKCPQSAIQIFAVKEQSLI